MQIFDQGYRKAMADDENATTLRDRRLNCRYVAHLDMLGMRGLALRDADLAWSTLQRLVEARDEILSLPVQLIDTNQIVSDRIRAFTFSDTIIVYSQSVEKADISATIVLVSELFFRALYIGVPLRGGIACGRFDVDLRRNLFAGPALVDAYQLGEESQWIGVSVDEEVHEAALAVPICAKGGAPAVIRWPMTTPTDGSTTSFVIDWVAPHRRNFNIPSIQPHTFYKLGGFQDLFGPFEELHERNRIKYENTVAFINDRLLNTPQ